MKEFILTENHIKLLQHSYIEYINIEFGAAGIDPKRPYGNSDVISDIAEILEIESLEDEDGDTYFEKDVEEYMVNLHEGIVTALQIIISTKSFQTGKYVFSNMEWKKID